MKHRNVLYALLALLLALMIPLSALAETLEYKDKGEEVRQLQIQLNLLGYDTGGVDGVYGNATVKAVKAFQTAHWLEVDGKAGTQTRALISQLVSAGGDASSTSDGIFGGNYATIEDGDKGTRVRILQTALNRLGYEAGKEDGTFGSGTLVAVRWFQTVHDLSVDGKAGRNTLKRIESYFDSDGRLIGPLVTPAPNTKPSGGSSTELPSGSSIQGTLIRGDTGSDVLAVQIRLAALGYYTGKMDGVFGQGMKAAVESFQQRNGLTVDGKVGVLTRTVLFGDTALEAAPAVTMPTRTLRYGDTGDDVKLVQRWLQSLGYYTGSIDGKYGNTTMTAVAWFQQRNGLSVDGNAGTNTYKVLFSGSAISAGSSTQPTPTPTPTPSGSQTGVPSDTLRPGDEGEDVKLLQTRLAELGYYVGAIDGDYGSGTRSAVANFQLINGLEVDGVAGSGTFRILFSSSAIPATGASRPTPTPTPTQHTRPTEALKYGDKNDQVKLLQTRLGELGYYAGYIDGNYGSGTRSAVLRFQQRNGLTETGNADMDTITRLYSASAIDATETQAPSATTPPSGSAVPPTRTLRYGDTGEDVASVQTKLAELGYYDGIIDGDFGSGLLASVRAFQQKNGLDADGVCGVKTYLLLYGGSAIPNTPSVDVPSVEGPVAYPTLKKGSTGDAVEKLQRALLYLNYEVDTDGTYSSVTVSAVRAFQTRNGLTVDGVAGPQTQALLYSGQALPYENETDDDGPGSIPAGTGVMANPPTTSQIKLLHWYNDIKPSLPNNSKLQIYDPASGLTWYCRVGSRGQHADCEPVTLLDTQIMYKAFGNRFTWDEKPVYIKLPSGVWCIASMHDMPHESNWTKDNGFDGHLCIHFPRTMSECEINAPKNGVRHQNDIRKHWKKITGQDIPW